MPAPRQALLLAAGEGSRLRPLTDHVPKPLLPIDGRPVIGRLIEQLHEAGAHRFVVVIGANGDQLRRALEELAPRGCELAFVTQPEAIGTADAIQRGLPELDGQLPAFVAACDTVWRDEDVRRLVDEHARMQPTVTMAARRWPLEQLPHRSCLSLDEDARVRRVIEKPSRDQVTSAMSGSPLYVCEPTFWPYVTAVAPSASGKLELASALQSAIDDGHVVHSVEVADTRDLTRPIDLLRYNFPYLAKLLPALPADA